MFSWVPLLRLILGFPRQLGLGVAEGLSDLYTKLTVGQRQLDVATAFPSPRGRGGRGRGRAQPNARKTKALQDQVERISNAVAGLTDISEKVRSFCRGWGGVAEGAAMGFFWLVAHNLCMYVWYRFSYSALWRHLYEISTAHGWMISAYGLLNKGKRIFYVYCIPGI